MQAKNHINGDSQMYMLSPEIKTYSLIDTGFKKTRHGTYQYRHPLYLDSPYQTTAQLRLDINNDLKRFIILITDPSGLQKINIFKNKQLQPMVDLLNYTIKDLIERKILVKI